MQHAQIWRAIDALAARRGLTASGLARAAGLDPTTFNRSKRMGADGKARWPSTESLSRALEAAGAGFDEFAALLMGRASESGRSIPIVGLARSPSRFVVLVALGVALLFAMALVAIGERWPQRRRLVLGALTALLLVELSPAPRQLYAAAVPAPFHRIAEDPRTDVRVLVLPMGVRDGTSSLGNFNPLTQYQQTVHGKRLVGGYATLDLDAQYEFSKQLRMQFKLENAFNRHYQSANGYDAQPVQAFIGLRYTPQF